MQRSIDFFGFVRNQGGQLEVMDEIGGIKGKCGKMVQMKYDRFWKAILRCHQRLAAFQTFDQSNEET